MHHLSPIRLCILSGILLGILCVPQGFSEDWMDISYDKSLFIDTDSICLRKNLLTVWFKFSHVNPSAFERLSEKYEDLSEFYELAQIQVDCDTDQMRNSAGSIRKGDDSVVEYFDEPNEWYTIKDGSIGNMARLMYCPQKEGADATSTVDQ